RRHAALGLLRIDDAAVHHDVERAEAAHADTRGHTRLASDLIGEAHGLAPEIASDQAALDLDIHAVMLPPCDGPGRHHVAQCGSICSSGSRFFGSGCSVPTPCWWTRRTTASLNGVLTPTRLPSLTTKPLR